MAVERHPKTGAPILLVADGGLPDTLPPSTDPIADWIDLMEVVEALCSKWPEPELPRVGWVYRL
jgi:hypothetical protein